MTEKCFHVGVSFQKTSEERVSIFEMIRCACPKFVPLTTTAIVKMEIFTSGGEAIELLNPSGSPRDYRRVAMVGDIRAELQLQFADIHLRNSKDEPIGFVKFNVYLDV